MKPTVLLIHYGELALKGKNRDLFEKRLVDNIRIALGSGSDWNVRRLYGRIVVHVEDGNDIDELAQRIKNVFGIANIAPAVETKPTLESIEEVLVAEISSGVSGAAPFFQSVNLGAATND